MIRFRTIDPAKDAAPTTAAKPAAPAGIVETGAGPADEPGPEPKGSKTGKGMTRKTPMRAKKQGAARTFRD
ncbi:MAG: hypothetical protein K2Z25_15175 [Beijerinckiaceae bacterium]|nr:hypothetical protein [Beijerinckiaceae bacterium]